MLSPHFIPLSHSPIHALPQTQTPPYPYDSIKVYIADLPKTFNYGLLDNKWSSFALRPPPTHSDSHHLHLNKNLKLPPYLEIPLIKQYIAWYWIIRDLMTLTTYAPPHLPSKFSILIKPT